MLIVDNFLDTMIFLNEPKESIVMMRSENTTEYGHLFFKKKKQSMSMSSAVGSGAVLPLHRHSFCPRLPVSG